tara:strand:- start:17019 stop:19742 length:2724 start_codon:yes stop_codon:yes gene_type:complete
MVKPTIPNGDTQFFNILYEGTGLGQRVGKFVPFTPSGTIANSCIFNGTTNNYLGRTASSNGSATTLTFSCWVKRGLLGLRDIVYNGNITSNSEHLHFDANNKLNYYEAGGGSRKWNYVTTRTFEDTSKFYHILVVRDTTISTQADRIKIYVDGERITAYDTETQPSLNATGYWNQTSYAFNIGTTGSASYIRGIGYLAEVNMIDGQALLPASFGEIDTSTGRWVPSTVTPYPTTTTSYAVTVVGGNPSNHPYHNVGSTNKFAIDGSTATADVTLNLVEGATYRFDQSDNSNSGHPLRFSTTANGTHGGGSEYTTGVTTNGTPGSSGAYTQITVASGAPTLYYYCTNHSAMGWTANTPVPYGTNGFRLQFGTASALGDDTSGLTNDFTATNLATTDQTTDSPSSNFATLQGTGGTLSEGNLKLVTGNSDFSHHNATLKPKSGKYYAEFTCNSSSRPEVGVVSTLNVPYSSNTTRLPATSDGSVAGYMYYGFNGQVYYNSSNSYDVTYGTYTTNDIIGIALDLDNHTVQFFKNNSSQGTISLPNGNYTFAMGDGATGYSGGWTANFGQKSFTYTPPSGFNKMQQQNLPESVEGLSGLVWTKNRDATDSHQWYDSSRGKQKVITSNANTAETTVADGLQKFLKGGQQIEDDVSINTSGESYVSWNWVNSGTTVSNSNGSITSTVQANTTAGFSIVQYTGTGSNATVGHGLSSPPSWIIIKNISSGAQPWHVYHKSLGNTHAIFLSASSASSSSSQFWQNTTPTSSVFSIGTSGGVNGSSNNLIAYCWHDVEGFSRFSSYKGRGVNNFVYTGFAPKFVMIKKYTGGTFGTGDSDWMIFDNKIDINKTPYSQYNRANLSNAESYTHKVHLYSNGFMVTNVSNSLNATSGTYLFHSFAEHPFTGDGTSPVTAR